MEKTFYEFDADKNDYFGLGLSPKTTPPPHFHKSLELIYCVKGSMKVFINKRYYTLKENQMCFIPSSLHTVRLTRSARFLLSSIRPAPHPARG